MLGNIYYWMGDMSKCNKRRYEKMSRKSLHARERRKKDKGGSGFQWGSRTKDEVEMMGQTKVTDVSGIGPTATKRLKKAGIVELSEADEFKTETGDILQKDTKLSSRQIQKLVSAREHAREIEIQEIREGHIQSKSKRQKKLKSVRVKKREPRASSMKHFIKDYAYKRYKEHDVAAPSDQWDVLKDRIDWHGAVSEAWDITYAYMREKGFETDKEHLERMQKVQEAAGKQQTAALIDEFERGKEHIDDQEERLYSDITKIAKEDTIVRKELVERSRSQRHFNKAKIRRLELNLGSHKLYMDKIYEQGTEYEQRESEKKLKQLQKELNELKSPSISKQHRMTGERIEAGTLPDLPGHVEEQTKIKKPRPAETLDIYNPKQQRFQKNQPTNQIRVAYDKIRADEPAYTGLIPIDILKKRIHQTDSTLTDKQIDESLLDMERKRIVDLQIAYDPTKAKGKEYGIKTERGLIMYVRYR